jgi:hypothetical protein
MAFGTLSLPVSSHTFSIPIMNIFFTRLLKIQERLREINFRRLPTEGAAYHVDTTDDRGVRLMWLMKKEEKGLWVFSTQGLPSWIVEAEGLLAAAIEEGEATLEHNKRTA